MAAKKKRRQRTWEDRERDVRMKNYWEERRLRLETQLALAVEGAGSKMRKVKGG